MGARVGELACGKAHEYFEVERREICHVPPGNPSKARTITVSSSSVPAHVGHGDLLGACGEIPEEQDARETAPDASRGRKK